MYILVYLDTKIELTALPYFMTSVFLQSVTKDLPSVNSPGISTYLTNGGEILKARILLLATMLTLIPETAYAALVPSDHPLFQENQVQDQIVL